ncbi:hypothetical protein [Hymenobacter elongatus]|uniref:Uncharacterized protein n=1 Tax=Hymenobacter elongatus TaxID=877208 RepID=A0A4Z0PQ78_9BACT|nr:hypothetical protein [Hymenobacter elongatus]TGE19850.1 hypothetical protein E5J99_01760 [Hymenobacter elongatus]
MRKTVLLLTLLLPLAFGCQKDNEAEPSTIDFGPGEGVTYRNANNVPMAYTDPSDWTADAQWNSREKALFSLPVVVNLDGPQTGVTTDMSFYPNPISPDGVGIFRPNLAIEGTLRLIWVDKNYKVMSTNEQTLAKGTELAFQFPQTTFPKEQKYRLYYVLYKADGTLIYKGHGDVHIRQQ